MRVPRAREVGGQWNAEWGYYCVTEQGLGLALAEVVAWRLLGLPPSRTWAFFEWLFSPVSPRTALVVWGVNAVLLVATAVLLLGRR